MKKQYIVKVDGINNRKLFYDYVKSKYHIDDLVNLNLLDSNFPFVVDFKKNSFWICDSITCCACAVQCNKIISEKEFKKIL